MFTTKVTESTKKYLKNNNVTEVISPAVIKSLEKEINTAQIINKVMFAGLSIVSVVIFYLAIASLML